MATNKGFIKDYLNNTLLPITRGELILDSKGEIAFFSDEFVATYNHPGLITPREKAMLQGNTEGSFEDLCNKVNYINSGLYFNNQGLNFYKTVDDNIVQTPIRINGYDGQISITTANNVVQIGLSKINPVKEGSPDGIIKSIDVDDYGRVTKIKQSDLQTELYNKTIENVTLKNCITNSEEIGNDVKSIVNKKYVDDSIKGITGIAIGALKFGGIINSHDVAKNYLSTTYLNNYYKVTDNFILDSSDLYESTNTFIKKGDTLIVYLNPTNLVLFVHVPSGDEETTTISVYVNNENDVELNVLNNAFGNIKFKFSNIFSVDNIPNSTITTINLKQASANQSGYLSAADYARFNTYSSKSISFIQTLTSGYEIGKFVLDDSEISIYGKDTISTLSLINNGESPLNPILKFEKSGENPLNIGLIGNEGLNIRKNNNNVEFTLNNLVDDNSKKYLEIKDGYKFNIKIGSVNEGTVNEGITDYKEFNTFKNQSIAIHALATQFLEISNSLSPSSTDDLIYYYGSADLIDAIKLND